MSFIRDLTDKKRAEEMLRSTQKAEGLAVLDQDWEEAFFVEKCPGCFAAVLADDRDE